MTTEREYTEWHEKIRRVRKQAPRPSRPAPRTISPLWKVCFFLSGLAIALLLSNQLQQNQNNPSPERQFQREFHTRNPTIPPV